MSKKTKLTETTAINKALRRARSWLKAIERGDQKNANQIKAVMEASPYASAKRAFQEYITPEREIRAKANGNRHHRVIEEVRKRRHVAKKTRGLDRAHSDVKALQDKLNGLNGKPELTEEEKVVQDAVRESLAKAKARVDRLHYLLYGVTPEEAAVPNTINEIAA